MIWIILVFFGLTLGSFINALVWRVHKQSETAKTKTSKQKSNQKYSIVTGRSCCTHCKHMLQFGDLIPIISWLWLHGRCRYCGKKIEDSPLVELITPVLFVISYAYWPLSFSGIGLIEFVFWILFVTGFVALAVYDLKWYLLPNRMVYPLIGLAFLQLIVTLIFYHGGFNALANAFWGAIVAGGIFYLIFQVSGGKWIGGGDVKLGLLLGIIIGGPLNSIMMLFIASSAGTIFALPFVITGRANRSTHIPFGPLLVVGAIVVRLFGASFTHWLMGRYI